MGEDVRFESIGGYLAGGGPGAVVVLHEWHGVVPHIRDVTDRVAAAGFTAVALDLYDGESAARGDDAEAARLQRQSRGTQTRLPRGSRARWASCASAATPRSPPWGSAQEPLCRC
ncbi:MAG: hypothetical protein E6G27_08925 [Actinobacteria bacterium]|nr:MAG: hypothetical protein E6G27_08925 [Actinomycetota bacterium]